jgi:undecaprenyl-diphosphatase
VRRLWKFLRELEENEIFVLVGLLVILLGTWAFIELADVVGGGGTQHFDERVVRSMRRPDDVAVPIGPAWLQEVARDVTALGGYTVLILIVTTVAIYLRLDGKRGDARFLLAAVISGYLISMALKAVFGRERPDVPYLAAAYHPSFPSGHSMMSAIVYLTLGALLSRFSTNRVRVRIYIVVVALFLTGIVGVSRVYLGVHFPTDVLAGWIAGLVWAALCSLIAQRLQRRGMIEKGL